MLPTSTNVTIEVKTNLPPDTEAVIVFAAMGGKISGDTTLVVAPRIEASVPRTYPGATREPASCRRAFAYRVLVGGDRVCGVAG